MKIEFSLFCGHLKNSKEHATLSKKADHVQFIKPQ
jgi:hypothetical protein